MTLCACGQLYATAEQDAECADVERQREEDDSTLGAGA